MTQQVWRILIGLAVAAHGVGHVYFLIPVLGIAQFGQEGRSWLLSPIANGAVVRPVGALVWAAATVALLGAGVGILTGHAWWRDIAVAGSLVSLLGIGLFVTGLPLNPAINPVIFDVVTLVALLVLKWPSAALIGS
jgi:hypothetical protein